MTTLTSEAIASLRAAHEAATPGPWKVVNYIDDDCRVPQELRHVEFPIQPGQQWAEDSTLLIAAARNALIAAARNALPELLDLADEALRLREISALPGDEHTAALIREVGAVTACAAITAERDAAVRLLNAAGLCRE